MIRLTIPSIEEDDLEAVRKVLQSGYLIQGDQVKRFEERIADYIGTRYAIAVSNCTAALHLALLALQVEPGDLVLVTTYSWPATANVIELCGATPVFIDIRPDTFNMDEQLLESSLLSLMADSSSAHRVKAIIPVHVFGQMANIPEILELANRYSIPVVEDAACALGASWEGRKAGAWGKIGCFSFHPRKAITTGEGGMITTDDLVLANRIRSLRNHGLDPESPISDFIMPGYNYRLTEFQAALGLTQFSKLERIISKRIIHANKYIQGFKGSVDFQPQGFHPQTRPVYQSFVGMIPARLSNKRKEMLAYFKERGVEATIGTWHMPLISHFARKYGYCQGSFPSTDLVFERAISLPLYEKMGNEEIDFVINLVTSYLEN
jgi:perosamine synthetase